MRLSFQSDKISKGLVGLMEIGVAVKHKGDKEPEVSELSQRPSNYGQECSIQLPRVLQ